MIMYIVYYINHHGYIHHTYNDDYVHSTIHPSESVMMVPPIGWDY